MRFWGRFDQTKKNFPEMAGQNLFKILFLTFGYTGRRKDQNKNGFISCV